MKRFLLVIGIITFIVSMCVNSWAQSNQTVNNGTFTADINFPATGCVYNWINTEPGIGLPAQGTGDIPAFMALNTGDSPIVATITATPVSGCTIIKFTITVNPTQPAITAAGTPIALSTIYGTASAAMSFNASGVNLTSGVLVTPPQGFEVSANNINFSSTVTLNSDNAQLSYISLNPDVVRTSINGTSDYNYSAMVDNSVQSIRVKPIAASAKSTITINGVAVSNGLASAPIALNPGANTINIIVTAQNGITTKSYAVTVIRAGSSDATLSGLTTSQGAIGPAFSPGTISYTTTVYNPSITITPTAANNGATVKVNGIPVASGTASPIIALSNANNTIPIVVTAQDGVTMQTYTLTIISTKSTNAGLNQLSLTPSALLTRVTGTANYTTTVNSSVASVQQTVITSDANATITVNGIKAASGVASAPIMLNATGITTITTVITAQDQVTTKTYTVTISKSSPSNASFSQLFINPNSTIVLAQGGDFTTSVSPTVTSVQQTVIASDENATVTVNGVKVTSGVASNAIPLNVSGTTVITTVITAPNGINTKTYTLTISKNGSSNIYINKLSLNLAATITQILGTTNYSTSVSPDVSTIQETVVTNDAKATIKVNGIATASGTASTPIALNPTGTTTITNVITAEDGHTTQTYNLIISRNGATNTAVNQIALTPASTLVPVSGTNNYTTSVSQGINSVQQTIIPADANATIKINGVAVSSGAASSPINLNASGTTNITAVITAQDGITTQTYIITVRKNGSTNTTIDQLALTPAATLTPVPGTNSFTTSVIPAVTSIQQTVFPNDPDATISINGIPVAAGVPSSPIFLNAAGKTNITIVVTAPDGLTAKTYTVIVAKNGSTDADIDQLYLTPSATLTAIAGTNNYLASINTAVTSIQLTTIPSDDHATIAVNGFPVASGAASAPVTLNTTGITTIKIVVTAQDGISTKTYLIVITRGSNGELLSPLTSDLPVTPVYIRLTATTPAGVYAGNIVLSSGSTSTNLAMDNCTVYAAPLTITTSNVIKNYGATLTGGTGATAYAITSGTLKNGNTINSFTITYGAGAAAGANAGNYRQTITLSNPIGSNGFISSNYNITYIPADIIVLPVKLTIKADDLTKDFGVDNPPLTITYTGFVNGEGPEQLISQPVISTTAVKRSTVGKYPITVGGAASANYLVNYIPGVLTVSAEHLSIFIPNTITPNGDGINDTWNIRDVDAYPNTTIDVFNRQGQKVFTSVGYGLAWDGTYRGSPLPTGTYYYFIKNNTTVMSGNLTIIR